MRHHKLLWPLLALFSLSLACSEDTGGDTPLEMDPQDMGASLDQGQDQSQEDQSQEDTSPEMAPQDMDAPDLQGPDLAPDAAPDAAPEDAGPEDAGPEDAGPEDAGPEDMAPEDMSPAPDMTPQEDMGAPQEGPGAMGPWLLAEVSATLTREDRQIPVVALLPQGIGEPAPLVVLSPGFQLEASRYRGLAEHLASHGFVVVLADPPSSFLGISHAAMALDLGAALDWATTAGTAVGDASDPERVGVVGHSLGGKLSFMLAAADPRVGAVLGIDPVNGGNPLSGYSEDLPDIVPDPVSAITAPVGLIGETVNASSPFGQACAPEDQNFYTFLEAASSSPWAVAWEVEGADHMDFLDDTANCLPCLVCTPGSADPAQVLASTRTVAAAFFRLHLQGDAAMEAWLTGADVPPLMTATPRP